MEPWREELYHGVLGNLRTRVSNTAKNLKDSVSSKGSNKSSGSSKGREWTYGKKK